MWNENDLNKMSKADLLKILNKTADLDQSKNNEVDADMTPVDSEKSSLVGKEAKLETLDDDLESNVSAQNPVSKDVSALIDSSKLNKDDLAKAHEIAKNLDLVQDPNAVMNFGLEAQNNASDITNEMLSKATNAESGEIGDQLSELMGTMKKYDPKKLAPVQHDGFLGKLISIPQNFINKRVTNRTSLANNIDLIESKLKESIKIQVTDYNLLDKLYKKNGDTFKKLSIDITAGKIKLDELNKLNLELKAKANKTKNDVDVQNYNELTYQIDRLEKRVYNLELARTMVLQDGPMIRESQAAKTKTIEGLQSNILLVLPSWKRDIALALTTLNQQTAQNINNEFTEKTNKMKIENAQMLHASVVDAAKSNERGIVDYKTLESVQKELIESIEDVQRIHTDGVQKRKENEKKAEALQVEFRDKLIKLSSPTESPRDISRESSTTESTVAEEPDNQ